MRPILVVAIFLPMLVAGQFYDWLKHVVFTELFNPFFLIFIKIIIERPKLKQTK
jgi:hypothetical protein